VQALGLPPDFEPMGAIGVGHPAGSPAERPVRDPEHFTLRQ
jgi:dehydro coenzyme F420 reductase / coenzyme F420-0:L-glutamate ligase / coenzyme F420-1:gamma-L-glutamate ligase